MNPRLRARLPWLLLVLVPGVTAHGAPPAWVLDAARQPTPAVAPDAPALVLFDEVAASVDSGYQLATRHRRAIRVLTRAGLAEAVARVSYLEKTDAVDDCTAWLIRGGKAVKTVPRGDWVDINDVSGESVYEDLRARITGLTDEAAVGDVFAFETNAEGPMLFLQYSASWLGLLPSLLERVRLQVPAGWKVVPIVKGPVPPASSVSTDGRVFTWELRDRPYWPEEPFTTVRGRLAAQLMLTLNPPPPAKRAPPAFASWAEVLAWTNQLNAGQCDSDAVLVASVQKLTAGCPDRLAKLRALARYVQDLRYVAVAKGTGIGFGYRARKATEVNAKRWGDCKDKANLICAMLAQAGVRAYPVYALLEDGGEVHPEWPSPRQFNHAIAAIEVDETIQLPAVVATPRWGHLLIFDATDTDTVLGDLPRALQGSKVLIDAPGCSELTTLPLLSADSDFLFERKVDLALTASGAVTGRCSLGGDGQAGALRRYWLRTTAGQDLRAKAVERLSDTLRGVSVASVTSSDDRDSGRCTVTFQFSAPAFAQSLQGGMLLVRLDVLSRDSVPTFSAKERRTPVRMTAAVQRDDVVLELPAGFRPDELPAKAVLSSPYGSYESTTAATEKAITQHRVLTLKEGIIPVADYGALRKFLSDVVKADRTAVVLRKAE